MYLTSRYNQCTLLLLEWFDDDDDDDDDDNYGDNKQLLNEVFVISRIIKVEVGVKGRNVFASSLSAGNTKGANLT